MAEETPKPVEGATPDATPEPEVHTLPTDDAPAPQADATPVDAAPAPDAAPVGQPQPVTPEQPPAPDAQPVGAPIPQPVYTTAQAAPVTGEKPSGTAPLVLGILSIVLSGGVIGIILGILGMTQGNKVLKVDATNGKAKAGKITGIIGMVLSILFLILYIASFAVGCSILGGMATGAQTAADEAVASIVNPSEEDRAAMMEEFESGFEASGVTLEDLGLTSEDIASWMFDSASYTQTNFQVSNDQGVVTYEVTSNKFETLMDALYDGVADIDYSSLGSYDDVYTEIGKVMKDAMNSSTPTTKTIDVYVSNDGSGWEVSDSDMSILLNDIFYYE